jgi:hypothetical protein
MEFEEFFENKRKNQGYYKEHGNYIDNKYSSHTQHSYPGYTDHQKWIAILEKIRNNKKLRIIAGLAGIFIVAIITLLFLVFMPLILKLFNYISQNGLQGLLDAITGFLDKIWKGSAK